MEEKGKHRETTVRELFKQEETPETPSRDEERWGSEEEKESTLDDWIEALKQAAEETLEEITPECKQDYIKKSTWGKMEERSAMAEEGDRDKKVNKLNKEIKIMTKADKKENLLEQFRENKKDPHKKHIWRAVKNLKGKFSTKFIQMRNKNGMLVPLRKRAEAIADYLEQKHWENDPEGGKKRENKKGVPRNWTAKQEEESKERQTSPFEAEELKEAIKSSEKGKDPGPDQTRMELIKWLGKNNRDGCLTRLMDGGRGELLQMNYTMQEWRQSIRNRTHLGPRTIDRSRYSVACTRST